METISSFHPNGKWHGEIYTTLHTSVSLGITSASNFLEICIKKNKDRSIPLVIRGGVCVDHKHSTVYYPSHGIMVEILNDWSNQPSLYIISDQNLKDPMIRYCFNDFGKLITGSFLNSFIDPVSTKKSNKMVYSSNCCVLVAINVGSDILDIPSFDNITTLHRYAGSRYLMILEQLSTSTIDQLRSLCSQCPCAIRHGRNIIYHRDGGIFDSQAVKDVKNMLQLCIDLKCHMLMSQIIAHEIAEYCRDQIAYNENIHYNHHCIYSYQLPVTHTRLSNQIPEETNELTDKINDVHDHVEIILSTSKATELKLDILVGLLSEKARTLETNSFIDQRKVRQQKIEPLYLD